jgi:large subunit ribosomal protein L16
LSLRPRKFTYKNRHKNRSIINFRKSTLSYGHFGLRILQPLWVNSKQVFRYKLFIKKAAKRADKTSRKVWFNLFPHLPLTRKVEGSRMGKGKGKLAGWVAQLSPGVNMFEFKNLRPGRAKYYFQQVQHRLPVRAHLIKASTAKVSLTWNESKKISHENFW